MSAPAATAPPTMPAPSSAPVDRRGRGAGAGLALGAGPAAGGSWGPDVSWETCAAAGGGSGGDSGVDSTADACAAADSAGAAGAATGLVSISVAARSIVGGLRLPSGDWSVVMGLPWPISTDSPNRTGILERFDDSCRNKLPLGLTAPSLGVDQFEQRRLVRVRRDPDRGRTSRPDRLRYLPRQAKLRRLQGRREQTGATGAIDVGLSRAPRKMQHAVDRPRAECRLDLGREALGFDRPIGDDRSHAESGGREVVGEIAGAVFPREIEKSGLPVRMLG